MESATHTPGPTDRAVAVESDRDFAYAPRVRVEWLIAGTRVLLTVGGIVAVTADPVEGQLFVLYLLGWYLAYGLGMLALVWAPVKFAAGWALAVHLFDFAIFSLLIAVTRAATSPFFMSFLFLLVCGTLRWQVKGTLWSAAAAVTAYAAISMYAGNVLRLPGFELNTFLIRTLHLAIVTAMLASLSAHQRRFQTEIGHLAAWPRSLSHAPNAVVAEILSHASAILSSPTVVMVWSDPDTDFARLEWLRHGAVHSDDYSDTEYASVVNAGLEGKSFQAADAMAERGLVVVHSAQGFRRRDCRPIDESLRARFDMRAVQSWPIEGELVRGRLFCVNKPKMGIDELVVGELVARQASARLDSTIMLDRLREAASLDERIRVAGDLHDGLLQAQAGAALQLLAARRQLDSTPDAARKGLAEVQSLLERGELEMRAFIRGLRPSSARPALAPSDMNLARRLDELATRIARQWRLAVDVRVEGSLERVPIALREEVYRLAQEALLNAARHAEASTAACQLSVSNTAITLAVVDDGRGFPFRGTFNLAKLNEMRTGPVTLKERVARLAGDLVLTSSDRGTTLSLTLPISDSAV